MPEVLVDSNILLDIATEDAEWFDWSAACLAELSTDHVLVINPIVYSEVSVGYATIEALDAALPGNRYRREPVPWEAAFVGGKWFLRYRWAGGWRRWPRPDFYIGAHAAVRGMSLLTRDARKYRAYFPKLRLIAP